MTTPRIYVGTYAKYNNGSIQGEWLDLDDYTDKSDFIQACLELHDDEEDPELMFQDWENIPGELASECSIDDAVWEYIDACNEFDQEAVDAYDEALRRAPGWADALADRESVATLARLAAAHAREVAGDDEAVCEDDEPDGVEPAGQPDEQGAGQRLPINQQQRAEQWLKRLDTSPADFLRRKFEIQARAQGEGGTPP